jgi:hypothetical protein
VSALVRRRDRRISGAVMVDGKMLCFDATDYVLEPGAQAVVIVGNTFAVETINADHPDQTKRRGKLRNALIPHVSGYYPAGTKEQLEVKVLGRFIPQGPDTPIFEAAARLERRARVLEGAA